MADTKDADLLYPDGNPLHKEVARKLWDNPEYRAKQRKALRSSDELRARAKALWSDPEYVARQKAARASREALKARAKALWSDPEYRAKQAARDRKKERQGQDD